MLSTQDTPDFLVDAVVRLRVDFDAVFGKIHQPGFRNPCASVGGDLHLPVAFGRDVCDLDSQQHALRCGMVLSIEIGAPLEQGKVRLWL